MKHNVTLTITSLLMLVLFSFHLTDDALHATVGMDMITGTFSAVLSGQALWRSFRSRDAGRGVRADSQLSSAVDPRTMGSFSTRGE